MSMKQITKGIAFLNRFGVTATIKKLADKILRDMFHLPNRLLEPILAKSHIRLLNGAVANKKVYILIPSIDWNIRLFQRPHQIASVLSKRSNNIVLFLSDQYKDDNFCFSQSITETLWLYSLRVARYLPEVLIGAKEVVVIKTWPMNAHVLKFFHYDQLIYEYIDDISLLYYITDELADTHIELMRKADLTVASANTLYQKAHLHTNRLILCENAGDYAFFSSERYGPGNPLIEDIAQKYSCVLGYYGSLASWVDYKLVNDVAKKRPEWLFVFVGHNYDNTYRQLAQLPNILYIPAQPYQTLPSFVRVFTIQIIPFLINEITKSTSPVKLFEYMASQKPILTSDLPECRKYKSVVRYTGTDDFIEKAENLAACKDNEEYLALLDKEAQENTWETRVNQILAALEKYKMGDFG